VSVGHTADPWGLFPEDDSCHLPPDDEPWWTETTWFSWMVPERKLMGHWYLVMRANVGVQFGGVCVFDDAAVLPWELPAYDWDWHEPLAEPHDLRDVGGVMRGMSLQCLEPGVRYRFAHDGADVSLDLEFEALLRPMITRGQPPADHGSKIDQPGRITGAMVLRGEEIAVDCISMRDRSWGVRKPRRQPRIGYCHATSGPDSSFLVISVDRNGSDGIVQGYLMRDGAWARITEGTRAAQRDDQGRPSAIRILAVDELGRELEAHGTTVSRQVLLAYPDMFCWNSLARWEFDGATAWGEDQDVWHPRAWRDFAQARGTTIR
jgi:hypothetical protein